jgi:hypothetical protein
LCILRVLPGQFAEFFMTGKELVSRSHPADLLRDLRIKKYHRPTGASIQFSTQGVVPVTP